MTTSRQRFKLSVSVFCVLKRNIEVLLILRSNTGYLDGMYSLPAGAIEGSEKLITAAVREASEEVGVTIREVDLQQAHLMHCMVDGNEWLNVFFTTENWNGTPEVKEPHKHGVVEWFTMNNLPNNTIPYIRQALEEIAKGKHFSEYGWEATK
jgi:8-oxo-dGTP pyrophosphatase MutT (NUDIX family)